MISFFKSLTSRHTDVSGAWRVTTAVALLLLAVFLWTDLSDRTGNRLYDQFTFWSGFRPPADVLVVAIDARSRERLGPWPLSRAHYAVLLERLNASASRPRALGFDLLFTDPRDEDAVLSQAMAQGLPVVLPQTLQPAVPAAGAPPAHDYADTWRLPLPVLTQASAGLGHIHVRFDTDGAIRGVQPYLLGRPHFSLALLQAGGQVLTGVLPDENYLRFRVVDPRINFTTISLVDALDPDFVMPDLYGKWVLLGVTDPALGDQHATIYSGVAAAGTPGVYLHASMLSAGLQQSWIRAVPPSLVFASCAVLVLLLQGALYRLRPRQTVGWALAAGFGLLAFSYGLLAWFDWWFNVVPALITIVLLWLFWAWYNLEGAVNFMSRKSRELGHSFHSSSADTGSAVERYAGRLDRAIDLQAEQLALLEQVLRHIPDGVVVLDANDKILMLNQSMRELCELQAQPVDWQLSDLIDFLHLPFNGWAQLQALAAAQSDAVLELAHRAGSRYVHLNAISVNKPGVTPLRLLTLTDVSDLRRSQALRDQALSFLSHDMRTPVASILAVTQQLTRVLQDSPAQVQMVGRVAGHAEQLMQLMDGFLIESRAHSQRLQMSERLVDDLVEDALANAQDLARLRAMPLVVVPCDTFFFVQVASQLMGRALLNVLMNAIKYGEPGTTIELRTRLAGTNEQPMVEIEVRNQVALNPESVDKDMLTQGFGLGLDLVQTVMLRHQGTARLDIPLQGEARVVLTMPCVLDDGS